MDSLQRVGRLSEKSDVIASDLVIPIGLMLLGEILIFTGNAEAALIVNGLNLLYLVTSTILSDDKANQALMLLPLFRLLNITMPFFFNLSIYNNVLIYVPMLIPIYIILRSKIFSNEEIGFKATNLPFYVPLVLIIALLLGSGESNVIHPMMLTSDLTLVRILIISIILLLIGFVEEFIFRSTLQTVLEEKLGSMNGLLLASFIFGMMHSGYRIPLEILYASFSGLIFGLLFRKSRSLPIVSAAHGLADIALFIIIPSSKYLITILMVSAVFFLVLVTIKSKLKRGSVS